MHDIDRAETGRSELAELNSQETATASNSAHAPSEAHLGYLDGLRAVAALYVVAGHAADCAPGVALQWYEKWLPYAHFAVGVFITLSGFVLMLPVVRRGGNLAGGFWGFMKRRARRILPPYYAALAASLLLIYFVIGHRTGTEWDYSLPATWQQIAGHVFLLQDCFRDNLALDYPCWSIAIEWHIYLAFPFLVACWRKWGPYAALGIGLLAGVLIHRAVIGTSASGADPWYVGLFSMGMLGAWIASTSAEKMQSMRERVPWTVIAAVGAAIVIAYCQRFGPNHLWRHVALPDYVVGLATTSLLVAMNQQRRTRLRSVFGWPPLVAVGTFAYSVYLIHAPLLQVFWQCCVRPAHLEGNHQLLVMEFIGLPLAVAASYPFFLLFERPWLVTRRRETLQQAAQDAAVSPAP